jgi:phosphoglycerate dehydrogenase-like enzyme
MLAMNDRTLGRVLTPELLRRLEAVAEVLPERATSGSFPALDRVEVLLTGWGCPPITPEVADRAPRLRAIVHSAGSVKTFLDRSVVDRGIAVTSAVVANAIPVAEYTVAAIVLAGKRAFRYAAEYRRDRRPPEVGALGNYRITVGLLGASRIGRMVADRLRAFDVEILLSDPYLTDVPDGVRRCDLDELFERSDVLSIHAPLLPETTGLVSARLLAKLRDGTVLINTARGRIVDPAALERECVSGRIDAILDVTEPEPLPPDSPLLGLPNVTVTPHLAGAIGNEIARLGALAVGEVERYAAGLGFEHAIDPKDWDRLA